MAQLWHPCGLTRIEMVPLEMQWRQCTTQKVAVLSLQLWILTHVHPDLLVVNEPAEIPR